MRNQKGFTLVELLIVVAILGVLAAVIIPNLGKMIGAGDVAAANTEADIVRTASLAYKTEHGSYPAGNYGKDNIGVLDDYIDKNLSGSYNINNEGDIAGVGGWDLIWVDGVWRKE